MLDGCVDFVVEDIRPAYALEGRGLRKLLSAFSTVHMAHQPVDLEEVAHFLPGRNTVNDQIGFTANQIREELKNEMRNIFGPGGTGGAIALDLWTDSHKQAGYMGIILHYINENFGMCERLLTNEPMESDKKKDNVYVLAKVTEILARYDVILDDVKDKIVFVTDRATYFIKAFENYHHITCALHFLSNSVEQIYKCGLPAELLAKCNRVVGYVKRSGKNDQFKPSLKSSCEVRWNSAVKMMESIVMGTNWDTLCRILGESGKLALLDGASFADIEYLIKFAVIFRMATESMETTAKPTLFFVLAWYEKIEKTLQFSPEDSTIVRAAKENARSYFLLTKLEFSQYLQGKFHHMSVFFHPSLKAMLKFPPNEREATANEVNIQIHSSVCVKGDVSVWIRWISVSNLLVGFLDRTDYRSCSGLFTYIGAD